MMFTQFTHRESLRDIEICLRSFSNKLYHIGVKGRVSRSTLSYANDNRSWEIYRDFAVILIKEARKLYINEPFGVELKNTVYAFDASIISLCLSVFPWAEYKETKAGIKLHTQIDLCGNIPVFIDISEASKADVVALDRVVLEPGAIYILDRAYVDFTRLYRFTTYASFFIVRAKKGLAFKKSLIKGYTFLDKKPKAGDLICCIYSIRLILSIVIMLKIIGSLKLPMEFCNEKQLCFFNLRR